jgi:hypothetical protein
MKTRNSIQLITQRRWLSKRIASPYYDNNKNIQTDLFRLVEVRQEKRLKVSFSFCWITDEEYLLPTIMSINSFSINNKFENASLRILWTGDPLKMEYYRCLINLCCVETPRIEVFTPYKTTNHYPSLSSHIINRFARFEAVLSGDDGTAIILVDSDVFFNGPLTPLLELLDYSTGFVAGVPEFEDARNAYLFFRPPEYQKLLSTNLAEDVIYQQLFGPSLTEEPLPQYNNGLLIFYKAKNVATTWKQLYLAGLNYREINPEDDQVALAHAIKREGVRRTSLDRKFNSLEHNLKAVEI